MRNVIIAFLIYEAYDLRQGPRLQDSFFSDAPVQGFPPYCGVGFVQVLVNFLTPCPHVVLQHCAFQSVKPPSIAEYEKKNQNGKSPVRSSITTALPTVTGKIISRVNSLQIQKSWRVVLTEYYGIPIVEPPEEMKIGRSRNRG